MPRQTIIIATILLTLLTVSGAWAVEPSPDPWHTGLGRQPGACLGFLFEVTFMKIDVAEMEAWLDAPTAASLTAALERGEDPEDFLPALMLSARELAFRLEFARSGDHEKFRKGMRMNLEAAHKEKLIDDDDLEEVWQGFRAMIDPLEEREALEGDVILFHLDDSGTRMAYFDPEGQALFDKKYGEGCWPPAIKGMFLARKSKFRDKWAKSLED